MYYLLLGKMDGAVLLLAFSADVEVVLADLALKLRLSHQMTSWPCNCFQGIVDLLRVFWWSGSRFGAPQNLAVSRAHWRRLVEDI